MKKSLSQKDNSNSDLCEQGLSIERCTGCVLEAPCSYKKMIKKIEEKYKEMVQEVIQVKE